MYLTITIILQHVFSKQFTNIMLDQVKRFYYLQVLESLPYVDFCFLNLQAEVFINEGKLRISPSSYHLMQTRIPSDFPFSAVYIRVNYQY